MKCGAGNHATRTCLAYTDDVGNHSRVIATKHSASAPKTGLNFIEQHQHTAFGTYLSHRWKVIIGWNNHSTFTLNGFKYHCGCLIVDSLFDRFRIPVGNKCGLEQRKEGFSKQVAAGY